MNLEKAKTVFLLGKNGQGKTNFLEAVYCLSYGTSLRKQRDEFLIKQGTRAYRLKGIFSSNTIEHVLEIEYEGKKKKIVYDNTIIKDRRELIDNYPCIAFQHQDLFLLIGGPDMQRLYLDQTLSLCSVFYLTSLQKYNRCLRQKNAALKLGNKSMVYIYNEILIEEGLPLVLEREALVQYIQTRISLLFQKISGNKLEVKIEYASSWKSKNKQEILEQLNAQAELELKIKYCLSGPHRDKLRTFLQGYPLKQTASTGQARLLSLLLRSIQSEYYQKKKKVFPTYLFDDVLLELDSEKQLKFLNVLPPTKQSFFTFLPEEKKSRIIQGDSKIFYVKSGTISEKK